MNSFLLKTDMIGYFHYTAYPDKDCPGCVMYVGKEVLPIGMKDPQRKIYLYHALYHVPNQETGYGGKIICLDMVNGTKRTMRGPWATNTFAVEQVTDIKFNNVIVVTPHQTHHGYMLVNMETL